MPLNLAGTIGSNAIVARLLTAQIQRGNYICKLNSTKYFIYLSEIFLLSIIDLNPRDIEVLKIIKVCAMRERHNHFEAL